MAPHFLTFLASNHNAPRAPAPLASHCPAAWEAIGMASILNHETDTPTTVIPSSEPTDPIADATSQAQATADPAGIAQAMATPTAMVTDHSTAPVTLSQLLTIVPDSTNCSDAQFPNECASADAALPHINSAFAKYNITHPSVRAAIIATMAFESESFKYNRNHYPGLPGQGTKAMLMPNFVHAYAAYLGLSTAGTDDEVLDRVSGLEETFGSAAWYITQECPFLYRSNLWGGSEISFQHYVTGCLGAGRADLYNRTVFFDRGVAALGNQ